MVKYTMPVHNYNTNMQCRQCNSYVEVIQAMSLCRLRNIDARTCNHFWHVKAINITYSEFVYLALFIQHATRMRPLLLSSVACPAVPYFFTSSHKRNDFRKKGEKKLSNIKLCFDYLYSFCLQ
jgi:predicted nucleic acid-binding Zn ribbon protein